MTGTGFSHFFSLGKWSIVVLIFSSQSAGRERKKNDSKCSSVILISRRRVDLLLFWHQSEWMEVTSIGFTKKRFSGYGLEQSGVTCIWWKTGPKKERVRERKKLKRDFAIPILSFSIVILHHLIPNPEHLPAPPPFPHLGSLCPWCHQSLLDSPFFILFLPPPVFTFFLLLDSIFLPLSTICLFISWYTDSDVLYAVWGSALDTHWSRRWWWFEEMEWMR